MKKLIIKILNKIIDSTRKSVDEQEDNTNIKYILKAINKNKYNKASLNYGKIINCK